MKGQLRQSTVPIFREEKGEKYLFYVEKPESNRHILG